MKNQQRKSCFTLVEVLIAMGICIVGVVSIMGLFPVGANTARDANMAFYADQAADQMLHFTKYAVLKDTSTSNVIFKAMTGWADIDNPSSATTKPGANDEPADWSMVSSIKDNTNISSYLAANYISMLASSGTEIKAHNLNVYRIGFVTEIDANNDHTITDDEKYEDFACVVRLWATPIHIDETDSSSSKLPRAATFYLEVSWPADLPYARRQKAEYSIDVFVPEG